MSKAVFQVHPKHLATILGNAVAIMKERTVSKTAPRQVLLRYQYDDEYNEPQFTAVGLGRWAGGLDWCHPVSGNNTYSEVTVLAANPDKTDIVDDLTKLATAVRGTSTAASALVQVTMLHGESFTVEYGPQLLGELGHQGDSQRSAFERLEDEIDELEQASGAHQAPVTFNMEVLGRLKDIKAVGKPADWGVVDMAQHPVLPIAGVKIGPTFRAILGRIEREQFAVEDQEVLF